MNQEPDSLASPNLDPAGPNGPAGESQPKYIRDLGGRVQEISSLWNVLQATPAVVSAPDAARILVAWAGAPFPRGCGCAGPRFLGLDHGHASGGTGTWPLHARAAAQTGATVLEGMGGQGVAVAVPASTGGCHGVLVVEGVSRGVGACKDSPDAARVSLLEAAALVVGRSLDARSLCDASPTERLLESLDACEAQMLRALRLSEVLRAIAKTAVESVGAVTGTLWQYEDGPDRLRPVAGYTDVRGTRVPEGWLDQCGPAAERALRSAHPVEVELDATQDAEVHGIVHAVPLVAFEETVGALALVRVRPRGTSLRLELDPSEKRFVGMVAGQAALAMRHARVSDRLRESERRNQELQGMLLQSEKLAAVGEMSAKVAHEIRNPLSAIGGFARRIEKGLAENDPLQRYASIIAREIRRLEGILTEQLVFVQRPVPRFSLSGINDVARETVDLLREDVDARGVRLIEQYEPGIPQMLLDADRVKQVLLNILKNALDSTRQGNRVRIRTRCFEGWVQIEIANDGERMAGEILESIFMPFASTRQKGSGLGLAVAEQIVREHGGEIRVRTGDEWSVMFTVSLPIRGNEDRRKHRDRRAGRDRRKAA